MATFSNLVVKVSAKTDDATRKIDQFSKKAADSARRASNANKMVTNSANRVGTAYAQAGTAATASMTRTADWTRRATTANAELVNSVARLRRAFYLVRFAAAGLFVGLGISKAVKDVDRLAKVSQKLGVPVEQLQSIQFAAGLAGVSVEKTNMALQRMTRRVSEAAMGLGEAQKALQELGIDAQELNQLSADQQFRKIAEAMSRVTNQADKVRLGFKLFDSEGVDLVNALTGELAKAEARFRSLGATITRLETRNIERLVDSASTLGTAVGNTFKKILAQAGPALSGLLDAITDFIAEFQLIPKVAQIASGAINIFAKSITAAIKLASQSIKGLSLTFALLKSTSNTKVLNQLDGEIKAREKIIEKTKEQIKTAEGLEKTLAESALKKAQEGGGDIFDKSLQQLKQERDRALQERGVLDTILGKKVDEVTKGRDEFAKIFQETDRAFNNIQTSGVARLNNAASRTADSLGEFDKLMNELTGRGGGQSFADNILGKSTGEESVDAKLARALLVDMGNEIQRKAQLGTTPLTFAGARFGQADSQIKRFGSSSFGDGKSPLDGIIRNGNAFSQQKVDVNIKVTTDNNILTAEVVNSDQFKNATVNVMQEAARNDKR